MLITCPVCQKPSDNVKYLNTMFFLFLVLFYSVSTKGFVSCAGCMRKELFVKGFLLNIPTANVLYPIPFVFTLVQFLRTFSAGHSNKVLEMVRANSPIEQALRK